jgi:hypothetical protein
MAGHKSGATACKQAGACPVKTRRALRMPQKEQKQSNEQECIVIPRLLTADDVAEILGITAEEVDHLADEGKLGHVELTHTKKAYTMDLVAEFIEGETYQRSWRWDQIKAECENFG